MTPNVFAIVDALAVRESATDFLRCRGANLRVYASTVKLLANCDRRTGGCLFIKIYGPFQSGMDVMKLVSAIPPSAIVC